ncbi:MAG: phosphoglucosamine mutase [Deltaproteobacteria bacterium RBG_16_54_18]|nr:MAG: phosphoglucosamine mutase [Deltaproteobacteria bacterium RBG_16_54_18]
MKKRLFGTDGVRGLANAEPMTGEMAMQIGRATAYVFRNKGGRHRIVVGKDTRLSGYMLETALASGICSMGGDVLLVGPLPTPGIAFITRVMGADAGVVISASHNPFFDNGIKIFSGTGFKLPDEIEHRIEGLIFSGELTEVRPTAAEVGRAFRIDDAADRYGAFLKKTFPEHLTLKGLKIAVDCAHGAAYRVAPHVLAELGAEVTCIGVQPDGENINRDCGSIHPEVISRYTVEQGADVGMTLDGDADRVLFVDHTGSVIDGDRLMAICALDMMAGGRLKKNTLVATVMSNMGLELVLKEAGIALMRAAVGDRYVVEEMLKGGYNLGGEQSGHLVFLDHNTTGDGMITALQIVAIMQKRSKPLAELAAIMRTFPQTLRSVKVKAKKDFSRIGSIQHLIDAFQTELGEHGRVLVRYSGTEPVLRIMVEGEDGQRIIAMADAMVEAVESTLG